MNSQTSEGPYVGLTSLADFGWNSFFARQLDPNDTETQMIVRVAETHRGWNRVVGPGFDEMVLAFSQIMEDGEKTSATVGDWLLIETANHQPTRLLERTSLFKRRAPGHDRRFQLIAANIDTLFIVTSCNQDFNVARLERYLTLAKEADVTPILVLTKVDLAADAARYAAMGRELLPDLAVEEVNAKEADSVAKLLDWIPPGQSAALVGSSGVGKSTLVNSLTGSEKVATQGIREDDSKGRHTTTGRTFYRLPNGGWLLDTPGMRGLEVVDAGEGVEEVFSDIMELAARCKFRDCAHETEPGCAVLAAVESGELDEARFARWKKLKAEEAQTTMSLAERHAKDRQFGKHVKSVMKAKKKQKGG